MSKLDFHQKQLIETLKQVEEDAIVDLEPQPLSLDPQLPFEQKLLQRAGQLAQPMQLKQGLTHLERRFRSISLAVAALVFVIGAIAAGQSFSIGGEQQQVNFFWLLLILLGLHSLGLVFWLLFLVFPMPPSAPGLLPKLMLQLTRWLSRYDLQPTDLMKDKLNTTSQQHFSLLRQWLHINSQGRIGFWRFSSLSHGFWLVYLCCGLAAILLMLATRQFSFVWETTILSEQTFVKMTQALSWLPQQLGFSMPDAKAITMSQYGNDSAHHLQANLRNQWAGLLIASLICYGIAPRGLLWLLSSSLLKLAQKGYQLPLREPYYIRLRHQLNSSAHRLGVVDADDIGRPDTHAVNRPQLSGHEPLPQPALIAALELDPGYAWPPQLASNDMLAGHALDRETQQSVLQARQQQAGLPLLLCVDFWRTPDRGSERFINALLATGDLKNSWLILLHADDLNLAAMDVAAEQKLYGWHQVGATCGFDPEQILAVALRPDWLQEYRQAASQAPSVQSVPGVQK